MRTLPPTATRVAALLGASAVVLTAGAFPAAAASGSDGTDGSGVKVVNTETVQAYTDASGEVKTKRIYEQLALTGKGAVDLANPVTTSGLRNLDGFGGFDVKGGDQMVDVKVDGEKNLRSVSDFKGKLPLDISVVYKLDGKEISPRSLVGKSGDLEVLYTVKNVTGRTQTISYTDGKGGTVDKTAQVIVPMVGSMTVGLPSTFRDVKSGEANMAGDGEGGTVLSYTMTLLAPLGSDTATFGYTAHVTDAVAPGASVSALPVNPLESPTFKTAGDQYKGGAATGEELAAGAAKIDTNLLKLRDGAGDLLAGLIKLRNGAQQLSDGLNNEAAPGSAKLADGAGQLKDGTAKLKAGTVKLQAGTVKLKGGTVLLSSGAAKLNGGALKVAAGAGALSGGLGQLKEGATSLAGGATKLDTGAKKVQAGAGQLADGSNQLAAGAGSASTGSQQIAAGQAGLLAGLKQLKAGVQGLDGAVDLQLANSADYQALIGTLGKIVTGIGTPTDATPATLLGGLNLLKGGLGQLTAPATGLPHAKDGVDQVKAGLDAATATGGSLDQLSGGISLLKNFGCSAGSTQVPDAYLTGDFAALKGLPGNVQCTQIATALISGVATSKTQLGQAAAGLGLVSTGLDGAVQAINTQMVPGVDALKKALFNASCNPAQTNPAAADFCGMSQAISLVKNGIPVLVDTVVNGIQGQLLAGLGSDTEGCDPTKALICAAAALAAGGSDLSTGLGALSSGADKLAAGITELKGGTDQLADGTGQLSAGSGALLEGAGKLDAGGRQLYAGTRQLAGGTKSLVGGATKLDNGATDLGAGATKLDDGAGQLDTGAGKLDAGATKLADGLSAAASGSGQIADGLVKAAGGAPKLVDGAGRLSTEGTSKLVTAGQETAQKYGEQYALLVAGAKRAQDEKMIVGAPADSVGLAAYSYEIKGEDGEGSRNLMRGVAGLALLGAGGAVFALRRRLI